jgi:hypothetical protein
VNEVSEQVTEKSMFTSPSFSTSQETSSDTEVLPEQTNDPSTEPMFSSQVTPPMTNEPTLPTPEIQPETSLPSETVQTQQES